MNLSLTFQIALSVSLFFYIGSSIFIVLLLLTGRTGSIFSSGSPFMLGLIIQYFFFYLTFLGLILFSFYRVHLSWSIVFSIFIIGVSFLSTFLAFFIETKIPSQYRKGTIKEFIEYVFIESPNGIFCLLDAIQTYASLKK